MNQAKFLVFLQKCLPILYLSFFLSLFIGFRAVCSTCEGVILGVTLLLSFFQKDRIRQSRFRNYFVFGCLLFYLLQITAIAYTTDLTQGIRELQIKITLVIVPITFYLNNYLNPSFRAGVMPLYVLFLASSLLFCFGIALFDYSVNHDPSVFFYHKLVEQFDQHAVQFSILAFIGFIFLLEGLKKQLYILDKFFHFFLIAYYIFFIILLSSKLVIVFLFISLIVYIFFSIQRAGSYKNGLILSALVSVSILFTLMATDNPVGERFKDIFRGNLNVIEKNQFNPGEYLNGLQFRLLQWKLASEILHEHKAWIFGVSPGDAQQQLDKKYVSLHLFVGNQSSGSHGFLSYNTHNEFLETVLQTGLLGLISFLVICGGCIQMMAYSRKMDFWLIGTLILSYSFVESVFETQYGLLLFTFFPLFLFYTSDKIPGRDAHISRI